MAQTAEGFILTVIGVLRPFLVKVLGFSVPKCGVLAHEKSRI